MPVIGGSSLVRVGGGRGQDQAAVDPRVLVHDADGDTAPVGEAEHVRTLRPVVADEGRDVIGEEVGQQRRDREAADRGGAGAAPAAAQVEQHHVRQVGELRDGGQQVGVIPGRPAVNDHQERQGRIPEPAGEQLVPVDGDYLVLLLIAHYDLGLHVPTVPHWCRTVIRWLWNLTLA